MAENGATKRQRLVLDIISKRCWQGDPPSLREVATESGIRNVSAVAKHVGALRRKGLLTSIPRRSRGVRMGPPTTVSPLVTVPVYGSIPAGEPEDRHEVPETFVSVDVQSLGVKPVSKIFALRVSGESMIGRHILPGDIVFVEQGPEPKPGDIVAALIDGESTLKTFARKEGVAYLKAENPKYRDLTAVSELMIQGVFRGLIRGAGATWRRS